MKPSRQRSPLAACACTITELDSRVVLIDAPVSPTDRSAYQPEDVACSPPRSVPTPVVVPKSYYPQSAKRADCTAPSNTKRSRNDNEKKKSKINNDSESNDQNVNHNDKGG